MLGCSHKVGESAFCGEVKKEWRVSAKRGKFAGARAESSKWEEMEEAFDPPPLPPVLLWFLSSSSDADAVPSSSYPAVQTTAIVACSAALSLLACPAKSKG